MKELIKIRKSNSTGNPVVSARDLHEFLGVGKMFANWFKDRIDKYGFVENVDFATIFYAKNGERIQLAKNGKLSIKGTQRVYKIEYAITLDCAKELAMIQNNAKGKEARQYFIAAEKELRELKEAKSVISYSMSETAMSLSLTDYFGRIGRNSLYNILYHHKIVDIKNQPLLKYVKKGYFSCKPTRVSETGLKWLKELFGVDKNTEHEELKSLMSELQSERKILKKGITAIVETLLYNKGGNLTADKNRLAIVHLRNYLEEEGNMQKALE